MMASNELTKVIVETELGAVTLGIDEVHAPISAGAFLAYVDKGLLDGTTIYRIVNQINQAPEIVHRIEVIQWGHTFGADDPLPFPPIPHEPTSVTGLRHQRGTISMARREVGTAGHAYFFCVGGDLESLDFGGGRNPDRQGFAAFGQVIDGWDVIDAIYNSAEPIEYMKSPLKVTSVRRA
ncbi:hypothetical protein JP74_07150 [Devosia sp. 17-2-E-8]|nr:hypothetical protein JP74_07150 [Devosia sp. 17-2-E-8]